MVEQLLSERIVRRVPPRWRIGEGVSWTNQAGRIVALELSSAGASPLLLDGSAAAIWEIISDLGPATELTIANEVLVRFSVSREEVERSLADFLERLEAARLIVPDARFTP